MRALLPDRDLWLLLPLLLSLLRLCDPDLDTERLRLLPDLDREEERLPWLRVRLLQHHKVEENENQHYCKGACWCRLAGDML